MSKEKRIMNALGEVNEEYIIESAPRNTEKKKKPVSVKLIVLAACLCLLAIPVTVFAASGFGTQIIEFFTNRTEQGSDYSESGYDLSVYIERIPVSSLSETIRAEAKTAIEQQYKEFSYFSSSTPGLWYTQFETHEDACRYIGLEGLKPLSPSAAEKETTLSVVGDEKGQIQSVNLETFYAVDDIRLQLFTRIYTENYSETITTGVRTTESVEFSESYYKTENDKLCHIISSSALESGYAVLEGFIVDNGILYNLHIAYLNDDAVTANELLYQWADLF